MTCEAADTGDIRPICSRALNHRQSWLPNELARGRLQSVTIEQHLARHAVSYLTARSDLERLTAAGYLRKRKAGKTSVYSAVPDLLNALLEGGRGKR